MKKLRITVTVPDNCPEGTALLFALAEVLKDVPAITETSDEPGKRTAAIAYMDQGDVRVTSVWLKA
jgi:hypothetical protein